MEEILRAPGWVLRIQPVSPKVATRVTTTRIAGFLIILVVIISPGTEKATVEWDDLDIIIVYICIGRGCGEYWN